VTPEFAERRRSRRLEVATQLEFRLNRRLVVRLVDISERGALVASDEHLPVGTVAELRLALAGQPFKASVQIRRDQPGPDRTILLGAEILSADRPSHEALEQFLGRTEQ
jgi:hypothetical protein